MNTKHTTVLLALALFALLPGAKSSQAQPVGVAAKGGFPEYLFLEKVTRAQAASTAQKLAKAVIAGRMIIFAYGKKLTDPELGDKGFTGVFFEEQWRRATDDLRVDATADQRRILDKLFWAGRQVIENNQDRLNVKGIAWKHFLPAKWEREMGQVFTARTGIIIKQPGRSYRNPVNVPDETERATLEFFIQAGLGENEPRTSFGAMGKQAVYRHLEPIRLIDGCLPCHGKPKGEPDMLGFQKDGLMTGDVIGLMSVTLAVSD
jgi:general secretion pathway protein A